jgi:hypothetical protein
MLDAAISKAISFFIPRRDVTAKYRAAQMARAVNDSRSRVLSFAFACTERFALMLSEELAGNGSRPGENYGIAGERPGRN